MVQRIGNDSALAREAMRAAQKAITERMVPTPESNPASAALGAAQAGASIGNLASNLGSAAVGGTQGADFSGALESGLRGIEQKIQGAESLPMDLLAGKVDDFHEIAVQLKTAELSFRFAMEIRNKLVDAYREIMRMSV